jgi:hypothetical protein
VSLADDLDKLDALRRSGALSEAEFEEASVALIGGALGSPQRAGAEDTAEEGGAAQRQSDLARMDREWQAEERQYLVRAGMGRREVPTTAMAFYLVVVGGGIGMIWIILTVALLQSIPAAGPLVGMRMILPLLGAIYTVFVVSYGFYCYRRAQRYQEGYRAYKARRQHIQTEPFP